MDPGYETKGQATEAPLVTKHLTPLHGLKQSPQTWHGTIATFLVRIAFEDPKGDQFVYIFNETTAVRQGLDADDDSTATLTLYVDDVLLMGGNKATLKMPKGNLVSLFTMSDMGDVLRVLGMQVTCCIQAGSLVTTQEGYTGGLLAKYGMQGCRPLGPAG